MCAAVVVDVERSAPLSSFGATGNNYFASLGSSMEFSAQLTGGPPNGPFYYVGSLGRVCGISSIRDGTTNTIGFCEWKTGTGSPSVISIPSDIVFIGAFPAGTARNDGTLTMPNPDLVSSFAAWVDQCTAGLAVARTNHTSALGETWAFDFPGVTLGNLLMPPNPKNPNCNTSSAASNTIQPGMWGAASFHPGGANCAMCDGSVRFLKDSINQQALWALGSKDQGEVVDASSY